MNNDTAFGVSILAYVAIGCVSLGAMAKTIGPASIVAAMIWPASWLIWLGVWLAS